ncbi:SPOR domain-containing protein [Candidatus Sumerlaeota bacterium]|nr:SPOR domain-containing protein [Candidatus Sumerlaeota bacterium]
MKSKTILMVFLISLVALCHIDAQGDILFSDTFTGTDGTRPANWKIVNAPETNFWFLQDGQLCTGNGDDILTGGGFSYAIISAPAAQSWTDYSIQTSSWMYQANGNMMIIARWLDENNHYRGVMETLKGARSLKIEKVLKGNRTVLAEVKDGVDGVNIPPMENGTSPADARTFQFIVSGSKLTFIMGGAVSVQATDASFPSGSAGVGEWFHYAYFDDVVVQKVQEGEIPSKPVSQIPTVIQPLGSLGTSASTPGTIFRILIGEELPEQTAKDLRDQLISWGYTPVELFQKDTGYDVYLGAFLSDAEAQSAKGFLEEEGLSPRRIVSLSGDKAVEVKKQATTAKRNFRVLAREFTDISFAEKMKKALEEDGYFPVEIVSMGANHRVYIGSFNNSDEADKLSRALKADGYDTATVIETELDTDMSTIFPPSTIASAPSSPEPFNPAMIAGKSSEWEALSEKQKGEVMDIITLQESLKHGDMVTNEILGIKKKIEELTMEQKRIVDIWRGEAEKEQSKQRTIAELVKKAENARDQRQWDEALKFCEEVKKLDPNNGRVVMIERSIKVITEEDYEGKKIIEEQEREKIKRARDMAESLEKQQKFEASRAQWGMVLSLAKPGSLDYNDANTAIGRIDGLLAEAETQRHKREQSRLYTLYGIGAIMLLLVFLIVMIVIRSRKHDRELLRQVQELTLKPLLELQEGKGPAAIEDMTSDVQSAAAAAMQTPASTGKKKHKKPIAAPAPVEVPEPVFAEEPEEIPEPEPIPAPDIYPVPEVETAQTGFESVKSVEKEELPVPSIDDLAFEESLALSGDKQESVPLEPSSLDALEGGEFEPAPVLSEPVKGPSVDVDDLFDETTLEDETLKLSPLSNLEEKTPLPGFQEISLEPITPSSSKEKKQTPPLYSHKEDDITEVILPSRMVREPLDVGTPNINSLETPRPVEVSESVPSISKADTTPEAFKPSSVDSNVIYEQDFDQEQNGSIPANWKGNYNYASLVVSDQSPAPDSRKCIVFEKEKGAGSAFYCCHFAETSGVVGIEFDLRCDMKNKYLLGFYIEKDEDYRYSIHTVIQYINSGKQSAKPSLRVQGKPVPYNWGDWRHIKYIVNLIDATVDGYVDGELIANGEKLASCPTSLNTISIRDNLATVGKLMIDNIKIYKA